MVKNLKREVEELANNLSNLNLYLFNHRKEYAKAPSFDRHTIGYNVLASGHMKFALLVMAHVDGLEGENEGWRIGTIRGQKRPLLLCDKTSVCVQMLLSYYI